MSRRVRLLIAIGSLSLILTFAPRAGAKSPEPDVVAEAEPPRPVHVFAQAGIGLVEFANVQAGVFLGRHLTVEGMAAWDGVFAAHYGGGLTYAFGHEQGDRQPRHQLLVGARVMFDPRAQLVSHGDTLYSYLALPVGYGLLSDDGFYFRATLALAVNYQQTTSELTPTTVTHGRELALGGPFVNLSVGYAF